MTDTFKGYNAKLRAADGEFSFTKNITSDSYPVLSSRQPRGTVATLTSPQGLAMKDSLVYADGSDLYYNGERVAGIVLSTAEDKCPKQFVSMGAYLCIFPDKIYLNTVDMTDYGYMEAVFQTETGVSVGFTLCNGDGEEYGTPTVSGTEPSSPENGALWIDTSEAVHSLKQYSASMSMWVEVASVYVKISTAGIGQGFSAGDGVHISGCEYDGSDSGMAEQIAALNGLKVIKARGDSYIVVTGLIDKVCTHVTEEDSLVRVERRVPEVNFVTECRNRLWGCRYGMENGETVNEIFCCKLGDFKNWECYAGISTDSFRASCGTDGVWTGAVTYLGYPMFFKEGYVHKVYASANGAHQIVASAIDGVQKGSASSLAIVGGYLIYKAGSGFRIFDGTTAEDIGEKLGGKAYTGAVGGRLGEKYYVSVKDDRWHMFVYDLKRQLWMREDSTHALFFAGNGDELYYVDGDTGELKCVRGTAGTTEGDFEWEAVTAVMGYEYPEKKYLSRFKLRMCIENNGYAEVLIEYDSNGIWEKRGVIKGKGTNRSFTLPVIPRRCDHLRIKLRGKGGFKLYSFARVLEKGA